MKFKVGDILSYWKDGALYIVDKIDNNKYHLQPYVDPENPLIFREDEIFLMNWSLLGPKETITWVTEE